MQIDIEKLSDVYEVKVLGEEDIPAVVRVCTGNPMYFAHTREQISEEWVRGEYRALPPGKGYEDKYYIGFFKEAELVSVMDLIASYPDNETAFIGFFMVNRDFQGKGAGTRIIRDTLSYLHAVGFGKVRLGYVKGNTQSKDFWIRNRFRPTGIETRTERYTIVIMERSTDGESEK